MFVKSEKNCREIIAHDGCRLKEILHPDRDPVSLNYSLSTARVDPGKATLKHFLRQTEVYFILSGKKRQ